MRACSCSPRSTYLLLARKNSSKDVLVACWAQQFCTKPIAGVSPASGSRATLDRKLDERSSNKLDKVDILMWFVALPHSTCERLPPSAPSSTYGSFECLPDQLLGRFRMHEHLPELVAWSYRRGRHTGSPTFQSDQTCKRASRKLLDSALWPLVSDYGVPYSLARAATPLCIWCESCRQKRTRLSVSHTLRSKRSAFVLCFTQTADKPPASHKVYGCRYWPEAVNS